MSVNFEPIQFILACICSTLNRNASMLRWSSTMPPPHPTPSPNPSSVLNQLRHGGLWCQSRFSPEKPILHLQCRKLPGQPMAIQTCASISIHKVSFGPRRSDASELGSGLTRLGGSKTPHLPTFATSSLAWPLEPGPKPQLSRNGRSSVARSRSWLAKWPLQPGPEPQL